MPVTSIAEPPREETPAPRPHGKPPAVDLSIPAFLVGVTGYMNLDDQQAALVAQRLRLVFRCLRRGAAAPDPDAPAATLAQSLARLAVPQSEPETQTQRDARKVYESTFGAWPGLGDVPIAVMSALAPGVDSIAAQIALEDEFRNDGFHVRAPLPFPVDLYREASTFVGDDPGLAERRQRRFDELTTAVGAENVFPVRLHRDGDATPEERREQLIEERDDSDPQNRRQRYYAAGEYLAVTAHLLIAAWDGKPGERPGTASVVRARLEGPDDNLLTMSQGIRQPAGGPALHLLTMRPEAERPSRPLPAVRLLYPFSAVAEEATGESLIGEEQGGWIEPAGDDARKRTIERLNRQALAAQRERFAVFCRIADNLRDFAECPPFPTRDDCEADYLSLVKYKKRDYAPDVAAMRMKGEILPEGEEGAFARSLRRLSFLRNKATNASRELKVRHDRSLKILFVVTLIAAALLHLYAHWHPHASHPAEAAHGASTAPDASHPPDQVPQAKRPSGRDPDDEKIEPEPWPKIAFGTAAALLAGGALIYFFACRMRQDAELHHDYRAVAEGVRVQFYWNLAGLGQSVSANYMHRQRSELDWIRAAIRSVSMPYEGWRERFLRLSRADQIVALDCVRSCWIKVQRDYFEKTWQDKRHTLHAWHKLGAGLALAGVGLVALCVIRSWGVRDLRFWEALAFPALAAMLWLGVTAFRWFTGDLKESAGHHVREKLWVRVVHALAPAPENHVLDYRTPGERALRGLVGFCARLPLALLLIWIGYELTRQISYQGWDEAYHVPASKEWRVIVGGVGLLAGALAVAWSEKNLLSELSYQYNTMHSLFRDAAHRMTVELKELKRLEHDATGEYEKKLKEIHEYLYALGKEALDENAEWLLLHRARPLEPVMAG